MRTTNKMDDILHLLKRDNADVVCAVRKIEMIEDLGEVFSLKSWEVVADACQGSVCYVDTATGNILPITREMGALEPLLRYVSQTPQSKAIAKELSTMLDCASPYVAGEDPENAGRTLIGVKIDRYDIKDASLDKIVEIWFGHVSVDTRLTDIHIQNATNLEWWVKHSPTTTLFVNNDKEE